MWRIVLAFSLALVGGLAMIAAIGCCHITFATNDYRPVLTAGFLFWLLGFVTWTALRVIHILGERVYLLTCGVPTLLVWLELLRRGPFVFFGVRW
jgi:hypothetical protein